MKIFDVDPFGTAIFATVVVVITDLQIINEGLNTIVLLGTIGLIVYKFIKMRQKKQGETE